MSIRFCARSRKSKLAKIWVGTKIRIFVRSAEMNKPLRNFLAFFGLVESQAEIEWREWYAAQKGRVEAGEEIEPPWVFSHSADPWSGHWRQGDGEFWIIEIWRPFWGNSVLRKKQNTLRNGTLQTNGGNLCRENRFHYKMVKSGQQNL